MTYEDFLDIVRHGKPKYVRDWDSKRAGNIIVGTHKGIFIYCEGPWIKLLTTTSTQVRITNKKVDNHWAIKTVFLDLGETYNH